MACPDRNKDAQILAEIERRKAMAAPPQEVFYLVEYEGLITDIQYMTNCDNVVSIEKTGQRRYLAKIRES